MIFFSQISFEKCMPLIYFFYLADFFSNLSLHDIDSCIFLNLVHFFQIFLKLFLILRLFHSLLHKHVICFSTVDFHFFCGVQSSSFIIGKSNIRILSNDFHISIISSFKLLFCQFQVFLFLSTLNFNAIKLAQSNVNIFNDIFSFSVILK
jgi:hypothetical protein